MVAEQLLDEIFRRGARQRAIEMEHQHRGGPRGQVEFLPLFERGQAERRGIGLEVTHWMRIERRNDRRPAFCARPANRFSRHRLVAKVEAIKIAQCDDRATQAFGQRLAVVEKSHAARSSATTL